MLCGYNSYKESCSVFVILLGGMYLENATSFLPYINKFYTDGAHTTVARDQMPSVSAPNWGKLYSIALSLLSKCVTHTASIITGMGPEESGVPDNDWVPSDDNPPNSTLHALPPISGRGKVDQLCLHLALQISCVCLQIPETMWRAAKSQDSSLVVAVAESWDWINYLVEDGIVDYNYLCKENDTLCAQEISYHYNITETLCDSHTILNLCQTNILKTRAIHIM